MEKIKKTIFSYPAIFSFLFFSEIIWASFSLLNFPLRKWFNDYSLSPKSTPLLIYLLLAFSFLTLFYYLFYRYFSPLEKEKQKKLFPYLIFFFLLFQITLAFIKPVATGDIYSYIYITKVFTFHHQNPYLVPPGAFPDPLKKLIFPPWIKFTLNYGPLWLLFSSLPTLLFPHNIRLGCFAFQILAILFNSGSAWLIFKILKIIKPNYKFLGTSLYFFNPLILWEIANNGHNDIIMVFFLLLSFYWLIKNKLCLSYVSLWAGIFVKYIPLIILPFWFIFNWKKSKNKKEKIIFFLKTSILSLFLIALILSLFLFLKINFLKSLAITEKLKCPVSSGIFFLLYLLFLSPHFSLLSFKILFVLSLFALWLFYLIKFKKENFSLLSNAYFLAFSFFVILFSTWTMPWYFVWIIPWLIISQKYAFIFVISFTALLAYIFSFALTNLFLFAFLIIYFYIKMSPISL